MLDERFVDHYAQASGVDTLVAERDIVLTYVLKVLYDNLSRKLAFKGGTCLKKVYLGKTGRFSMDLDFTGVDLTPKSFRQSFAELFNSREHYGITFEISEEYSRLKEESYGSIVRYSHGWNSGSRFKVEVSFRETPILPLEELPLIRELYFRYFEIQPFKVACMELEELLAEKIRAAFQRLRSRDLYDLYLFSRRPVNKKRILSLVVLKCWNAKDPFDPNLLFGKIENERYDWSDLESLVTTKKLAREKTIIKSVVENYAYLKDLDGDLIDVVKDSKSHRRSNLVNSLCQRLLKIAPIRSGVKTDSSELDKLLYVEKG